MPRPNRPNDEKAKAAVLEALRKGASAAEAAQAAGKGRTTVWEWRQRDEQFAIAYHDAEEAGTDHLETVARRRAVEGSDTLLIFLLKARRPDKYRDTYRVEQTTTIRDERKAIRAAAERDPEAIERLARALAGDAD